MKYVDNIATAIGIALNTILGTINTALGNIKTNTDNIKDNSTVFGNIKDNTAGAKGKSWAAVTANVAITQANLAGIVITGAGSLVLIGSDDSELDCGTVSADPLTVLPYCPKLVKTGSTATIKAIYGV